MARPSRERFVAEYLIDLNATQAAIRAGYSEKSARAQGSRLLTKADVLAAIEQAQEARQARTEITQDRVLEELAVVGFSSVWDYAIDDDGNVMLTETARPEAIRAVSSIKRKRRVIKQEDGDDIVEVETEIRLWDKPGVLRLAGQHLGMFVEKREVTFPQGGGVLAVPIPVDAAQWAATAEAQQALLAARPAIARISDE
jgi:phage terminase small subunit